MNDLLCQKMDELFLLLEKDPHIARLQELSLMAAQDENLLRQKEKLRTLEVDKYSSAYREERIRFAASPLVKEYTRLENEIRFLLLEIDQKFQKLSGKRGCS